MRRLLLAAAVLPLPAFAEVPKVVTDIAPIQSLVSMVMGDLGQPVLLVDGASDPHSFQLKPSQAADIESAEAIFWIGPGMTPWLDRIVDGLADPEASFVLSDVDGITPREPMFDGDAHDEHGGDDPHIWLDPVNAMAVLDAVAARLATLDPENAALYASNATAAKANLSALDSEMKALLDPVKARPSIVFHDAYAHFAGHFGLTIAGALAEGDAADPGAAQVAELRAMIEAKQVECVFAEALHSDKLILTLTDGLGVPVGRLDPEGTTFEPGPSVYPEMMRALAAHFAACSS